MALPWYQTDLADISTCEAGETYIEFTGYTLGDGAAVETDWYLQGAACASDEANNKTGVGHSIGTNYGSAITFSNGDCFFAWMQCQAGNAMATIANGGYRIIIGASTSDYNVWFVGGRDFGRNPYGGWVNVVADPTYTPVDDTNGTPGNYQYFGVGFNMTSGISKGRPLNMDATRYGRGQLLVTEGTSTTPCTFEGMANSNDDQDNRWGLFQEEGTGYLWKGLMSLGHSASACYFDDENRNITIDDTPKTYPDFNKIEIINANSDIYWTNVNFLALNSAGLSVGRLVVVDNATFDLTNCSFTDMNTLTFQSNSSLLATSFRRCDLVVQGGASFNSCVFSEPASSVGLLVDTDLESITYCDFISDGTGHGIELTASGDGTLSFIGNTFSNYPSANGSTGNEALYNNSGGHIIIYLQETNSVPSYRNGPGSQTDIQLSVTLTLTGIVSGSEVRIQTARGSAPSGAELYHVETTDGSDVQWVYNYSDYGADYYIDVIIHNVYYTHLRIDDILLPASNTTLPIQQEQDRWYSNP